jgi:Acyl-CoA reductase (LuxC)
MNIPDNIARSISVMAPASGSLAATLAAPRSSPFSPERLALVDAVRKAILADPKARARPEMVALAYWARAASLKGLAATLDDGHFRSPRGLALHIAPGNVDTMFLYSALLSVLAGNVNIVRVSGRDSDALLLLLRLLDEALNTLPADVRACLLVVRYPAERPINDALSALADMRVIWGGDDTVREVRSSPLPPHACELTFPSKVSAAVIDAAAWAATADQPEQARRFALDAITFGQQACSSPLALFWRGDAGRVAAAQRQFWPLVEAAIAAAGEPFAARAAVDKLVAEQMLAAAGPARHRDTQDYRLRVTDAPDVTRLTRLAGDGFFIERRIDALADLVPLIQRDWQTIASLGVPAEDWRAMLASNRPHGLDRIVPFGQALAFGNVWDGVNLLTTLTRIISIEV